ncbi:MAG TPA: glycosyltransferase family 4 protein [Ktedonobacteraceae bacterium]|nr:glycosyltransferase family 4 protein [Ktedonobacteraceae bacterium]
MSSKPFIADGLSCSSPIHRGSATAALAAWNNKPRIYIAISTFLPLIGGAETQTLAQSRRLLEKGYAVTVITFRHQANWLPEETITGVPVIRVAGLLLHGRERLPRFLQRFLYLLAMLVMSWTLWRHRQQFDVLQVCQFSLLVMPLALVCRLAGKAMTIVVISAGTDKATKTNVPARLCAGPLDPTTPWLQVDAQTWVDGDLYGFKKASKTVTRFTYAQLRHMGAVVIVLSTRMQRYLENNGLARLDIQLIPNGVDASRFRPAPEHFTGANAQTVICVSQLRYEKGIDVLLQAWHLVQQQLPDARLIIVGCGPLQAQLEQLASALCIADSIEFAGLCNDVPRQLHRGSIAVLPSRWEGMPNALLEAMASGLACVATRVSGSEDVIQDGYNGLLVEAEDYRGLADALLTLAQNPLLAKKYGHAARHTIVHNPIEQEQDAAREGDQSQGGRAKAGPYELEYILNKYIETYQKITDREQGVNNLSDALNQVLRTR